MGCLSISIQVDFKKSRVWRIWSSQNLLRYSENLFCYRTYKGGVLHEADPNVDYAANFAQMLGFQDELMHELMRLYISIHRSSSASVSWKLHVILN